MLHESWNQIGRNAQRLAYVDDQFGFPPQLNWMIDLGPQHLGVPIIVDDTIYVAQYKHLLAIDLQSGEVQWRIHPDLPNLSALSENRIHYTPVFYQDRVCFVDWHGALFCVEAQTGELIWQHKLALLQHGTLCAYKQTIFALFEEINKSGCLALDLDGNVLWRFETPERLRQRGVSTDGRYLIFGDKSGTIWALEPLTGKIIWTHVTSGRITPFLIGHPIITSEVVVILYRSGTYIKQAGLDLKTGELCWETHLWGPIGCNGYEVISLNRDASRSYHLCSVDIKTGDLHTSAEEFIGESAELEKPTLVIGDKWILAHIERLNAYDTQTGKLAWSFNSRDYEPDYDDEYIAESIKKSIAPTQPAYAKGRLVFGTATGKLYCFGEGPVGGSEGQH